jgi:hypothetical protein
LGIPHRAGAAEALTVPVECEAKTDSFLLSLVEAQWGHLEPSQFDDRTNNSKLLPQFPHSNSYNGMMLDLLY